jgi:hypothetical protein
LRVTMAGDEITQVDQEILGAGLAGISLGVPKDLSSQELTIQVEDHQTQVRGIAIAHTTGIETMVVAGDNGASPAAVHQVLHGRLSLVCQRGHR